MSVVIYHVRRAMLIFLASKITMTAIGLFVMFGPQFASAAIISKPFEVSGWIPYWRSASGTVEMLAHIDTFTEINPFGYTVDDNGNLYDAALLLSEPWTTVRAEAKEKGVRFIPTVMWSNPDAMHVVLSDPVKRAAHIKQIVDEVDVHDWDGIDIDYEGKHAETAPYFSVFLKELYKAMGNKWVQCTIEARTPLSDRYVDQQPPEEAGHYANDFSVINQNCDRVRFMTYDQQTVDQKRAKEAEEKGEVYGPVSDVVWVEKTIREAMKIIPKRKIVLGVPTYGYEWSVHSYANNEKVYDLLWSFNPEYALRLSQEYNISPGRNFGGEIGFTYMPTSSPLALPRPLIPWPWNLIAAAAAALTTAQNSNLEYRMVTWSDAEAIKQKVDLAKRLGIRGVAVFKIDGGADPRIWDVLK